MTTPPAKRDCTCPKAKHKHGTRGAYQKDGCRCFPCRIASSRADQRARNGGDRRDEGMYTPRCGVIRRLAALHCLGWSETDIAAHLGVSKQAIRDLRTWPSDKVLTTTHARIAAIYDELWDKPSTGRYAARTRAWAARNGFHPPLAWDDADIDNPDARPIPGATRHDTDHLDEVAIEEAIRGRAVQLTNVEMTEAVHRMTARGYSAREIADRLNTTARSVQRRRNNRKDEAA